MLIRLFSIVFQIFPLFFPKFLPKAEPTKLRDAISATVGSISIAATILNFSIFNFILTVPLTAISGFLIFVAAGSPLSGLIEAKCRHNLKIFEKKRFLWHLVTNILGAGVAIAFLVAAHQEKPWLSAQPVQLSELAALNIALPIAVIISLAFVYSQQAQEYPGMRLDIDDRPAHWDKHIVGFSLRHVHQVWNVFHLILVGFISATGILIAICATVTQALRGTPPALSIQLALGFSAITLLLAVFGLPAMREHTAVFWTFLAGMPPCTAVICVWLSLLKHDHFRDIFRMVFVVVTILTYIILITRGGGARPRSPSGWYRYTPVILLVEFIVVAGGVCRP